MCDTEEAKPIDLVLRPGDPVWIYGFPTTGKTTLQRTLRFLTDEQRKELGLDSVIDATDTDEWLGTFEMSQNPDRKDEINDLCANLIALTQDLKSHHPRVIVTNLWKALAEAGIKPALICLPISVKSVRCRVERRGDDHPEWITEQAAHWLQHIRESEWFAQNQDVVRYVDDGDYLSDCVTINGRPLEYRFEKEKAVVPVAREVSRPNSEPEYADEDRQSGIQLGKAIPDRFFSDGWKSQDKSKFIVRQWTVLDSYNQFAIFVVSTGMLTSSQLGICWDVGPWAKAIEINVETVNVIEPAMIHGVIAHEVNHAVTCIMQAICAQERSQEPEAYLTQQLVDLVTAVYKGDKHD